MNADKIQLVKVQGSTLENYPVMVCWLMIVVSLSGDEGADLVSNPARDGGHLLDIVLPEPHELMQAFGVTKRTSFVVGPSSIPVRVQQREPSHLEEEAGSELEEEGPKDPKPYLHTRRGPLTLKQREDRCVEDRGFQLDRRDHRGYPSGRLLRWRHLTPAS